jgi:diguanylate cyclase (GGDEF)-like protein
VSPTQAIDTSSLIATNNVVTVAVALVLLVSRMGTGQAVAGVRTWLIGDALLWGCRGWLVLHLSNVWTVMQDPTPVAGSLAAAAITLHAAALRRVGGHADRATHVAMAMAMAVMIFLVGYAAMPSLGAHLAWVHFLLMAYSMVQIGTLWPQRRNWGARVLLCMVAFAAAYNSLQLWDVVSARMDMHELDKQSVLLGLRVDLFVSLVLSASFLLLMQERLRERMERLMVTDALTGVLNRHGLMPHLLRQLERAERGEAVLSVTLFDLDHFKRVNDLQGHGTGDTVLAGFAAKVTSRLRTSDVFGRWGGEEFLLVLPDTPLDVAFGLSDRIRADIAETPLAHGAPCITISGGVASTAEIRNSRRRLVELLNKADERLYCAKATRNRVVAADAGQTAATTPPAPAAVSPPQPAETVH